MLGITFDDTIVLAKPKLRSLTEAEYRRLLFHELVHVAQYQRIGVDRFLYHYVTSWAQSGFRYERIILEMHAYSLDGEFASSKAPFAVSQRLAILMQGMN